MNDVRLRRPLSRMSGGKFILRELDAESASR